MKQLQDANATWRVIAFFVVFFFAIRGMLYDAHAYFAPSAIPNSVISETPRSLSFQDRPESTSKTYSFQSSFPESPKPPWKRTCIFVQSHGVDSHRANYTHQRVIVAQTWAKSLPENVSVTFVTDGWSPPGFPVIALNVTHLNYNDGPIVLFMLIGYIQQHVPNCDFYQFTDSDAYVHIPNDLQALSHREPNECLYQGYLIQERKWESLAVHGTLVTLSRRMLYLLDHEFCIKYHPWGYFDIRLGNCIETFLGIIPGRDQSELSDSTRIRQIGDELSLKWNNITRDSDIRCLIAIHKADKDWLMLQIHEDVKHLRCNKRVPKYNPTWECSRPKIDEKVYDNYWNVKKQLVDHRQDFEAVQGELRKHGGQFTDHDKQLAEHKKILDDLVDKVESLMGDDGTMGIHKTKSVQKSDMGLRENLEYKARLRQTYRKEEGHVGSRRK